MEYHLNNLKKVFTYVAPSWDESTVQLLYKTLDVNHDKRVDFKELMTGLSVLSKGTLDEKLEFWFQIFDSDKDGLLSKPELDMLMEHAYKTIYREKMSKRDMKFFEQVLNSF